MKDKKKRPEPEGSALGVFLTMEELADRLAVSQRTIYRWIRLYGLPSYKFGKTVRFEEKQVSKWIEEFFDGRFDEEGTNDGEASREGEDDSGDA